MVHRDRMESIGREVLQAVECMVCVLPIRKSLIEHARTGNSYIEVRGIPRSGHASAPTTVCLCRNLWTRT